MRILGIDYGDVRIGIAVSDLTGMIAQSAGVISGRDEEKRLGELDSYFEKYKPETVVLGYPAWRRTERLRRPASAARSERARSTRSPRLSFCRDIWTVWY